jgi:hypothetical protein
MNRRTNRSRSADDIITYAELVTLARAAGLTKIETEVVQLPTVDNGRYAVMRARVVIGRADDALVYDGTADASPDSCPPAMHVCLLRLAETRAKARALRDAVGTAKVAREELPDYVDGQDASGALASRNVGTCAGIQNSSTGPCPSCNAPSGKVHATNCTQPLLEIATSA